MPGLTETVETIKADAADARAAANGNGAAPKRGPGRPKGSRTRGASKPRASVSDAERARQQAERESAAAARAAKETRIGHLSLALHVTGSKILNDRMGLEPTFDAGMARALAEAWDPVIESYQWNSPLASAIAASAVVMGPYALQLLLRMGTKAPDGQQVAEIGNSPE